MPVTCSSLVLLRPLATIFKDLIQSGHSSLFYHLLHQLMKKSSKSMVYLIYVLHHDLQINWKTMFWHFHELLVLRDYECRNTRSVENKPAFLWDLKIACPDYYPSLPLLGNLLAQDNQLGFYHPWDAPKFRWSQMTVSHEQDISWSCWGSEMN